MQLSVRVQGLKELERKLGPKFLYHHAVDELIDAFVKRVQRPPSKRAGIGMRVNRITAEAKPLMARIESTSRNVHDRAQSSPRHPRFNPRVTGISWIRKHIGGPVVRGKSFGKGIFGQMGPRVVRKAYERVTAAWNGR